MKRVTSVTTMSGLTMFAILGILVLCAGCSRMPDRASLIVLPGADAVVFTRRAGSEQVGYQLNQEYPAKAALKEVSDQLAEQGWKPLKEDFLNPGEPSSHVTGWTNFGDGTSQPEQEVFQWLADWTNPDGDVIRYTLQYRTSSSEPTAADKLSVNATFIPAAQAKAARAEVQSTQKSTPELIRPIPPIAGLLGVGVGETTMEELERRFGPGAPCMGGHPHGGRAWYLESRKLYVYADAFAYTGRGDTIVDRIAVGLDPDAVGIDLSSETPKPRIPHISTSGGAIGWMGQVLPGQSIKTVLGSASHLPKPKRSADEISWTMPGRFETSDKSYKCNWNAELRFANKRLETIVVSVDR